MIIRIDAAIVEGYQGAMTTQVETCDVLVAGGGMVGLTLALALRQAGLEVIAVDAAAPAALLQPNYDGRASAIAFASWRMLKTLGVAPRIGDHAQPIEEIVVSDGRPAGSSRSSGPSSLFLHFDRRELDPSPEGEALGYMVENRRMRLALSEEARASGLDLRAPDAVESHHVRPGQVEVNLRSGRRVHAGVLVAADGRESRTRRSAGLRTAGWAHSQTALVVTVRHEQPHKGIAHEYFLPGGPFAILPLSESRACVVWTDRAPLVQALLALSEADFLAELKARFGDFLGELVVEGPRFSYPLSIHAAEKLIAPGVALVGDAGHGVHPIAGQGLNMGLRDSAALAEVLVDAARLGLDLGATATLERYDRWRRFDNALLAWATEGFNALFSNDLPLLRLARDIGMATVSSLPPARRFFMRAAGGGVGDLPRLLRGEALAI